MSIIKSANNSLVLRKKKNGNLCCLVQIEFNLLPFILTYIKMLDLSFPFLTVCLCSV